MNLEDAANIATELIYSLDNIPNEIRHILEEIHHKEARAQEIQHQIDSDSARWIRHTLRGATISATPASSPSPSPFPSTKSVGHLPEKINQSYADIERLSTEKIALAERLQTLITRTYTRLDHDLNRARVLQGENTSSEASRGRSASVSASPTVNVVSGAAAVAHPPVAIGDNLRQSSFSGEPRQPTAVPTPAHAPPTKKRRLAASVAPSIKLPPSRSISPVAPATKAASHVRSRLSRQTYPPPRQTKVEEPEENEPEVAEGEDEEDHNLYCFCQKPSAGEMIGCDGAECPYEWFHLECVDIKEAPPDTMKWYCPVCTDRTGRKGRKKS